MVIQTSSDVIFRVDVGASCVVCERLDMMSGYVFGVHMFLGLWYPGKTPAQSAFFVLFAKGKLALWKSFVNVPSTAAFWT